MITTVIFDWQGTLTEDLRLAGGPAHAAMAGAAEALAALHGRVALWVASGDRRATGADLLALLAAAGLPTMFDGACTGSDLRAGKQEPEFWQGLLARVGQPAAACVMVGDSYDADVEPATWAGLQAVWYAQGDRGGRAPAALATVHHLADLPATLDRLGLLPALPPPHQEP